MAAVRTWHPVRLALVCAVLAMAGGASSARAVYAEVSARAAVVTQAETRRDAAPATAERAVTPALASVARTVARPAQPSLALAPLYLAHCALLL